MNAPQHGTTADPQQAAQLTQGQQQPQNGLQSQSPASYQHTYQQAFQQAPQPPPSSNNTLAPHNQNPSALPSTWSQYPPAVLAPSSQHVTSQAAVYGNQTPATNNWTPQYQYPSYQSSTPQNQQPWNHQHIPPPPTNAIQYPPPPPPLPPRHVTPQPMNGDQTQATNSWVPQYQNPSYHTTTSQIEQSWSNQHTAPQPPNQTQYPQAPVPGPLPSTFTSWPSQYATTQSVNATQYVSPPPVASVSSTPAAWSSQYTTPQPSSTTQYPQPESVGSPASAQYTYPPPSNATQYPPASSPGPMPSNQYSSPQPSGATQYGAPLTLAPPPVPPPSNQYQSPQSYNATQYGAPSFPAPPPGPPPGPPPSNQYQSPQPSNATGYPVPSSSALPPPNQWSNSQPSNPTQYPPPSVSAPSSSNQYMSPEATNPAQVSVPSFAGPPSSNQYPSPQAPTTSQYPPPSSLELAQPNQYSSPQPPPQQFTTIQYPPPPYVPPPPLASKPKQSNLGSAISNFVEKKLQTYMSQVSLTQQTPSPSYNTSLPVSQSPAWQNVDVPSSHTPAAPEYTLSYTAVQHDHGAGAHLHNLQPSIPIASPNEMSNTPNINAPTGYGTPQSSMPVPSPYETSNPTNTNDPTGYGTPQSSLPITSPNNETSKPSTVNHLSQYSSPQSKVKTEPVSALKMLAGGISSLPSTLGSLSLDQTSVGTAHHDASDWDEYPMLQTPMRASGPPDPVARACIRAFDIDYVTTWYCIPSATSFMICSWCHANYIKPIPSLASHFESVQKRDVRCLWHEPRVTKVLWPEARRTGDLEPLAKYMSHRVGIPHCKGADGVVLAKDNFKWYALVGKEIGDFDVCEACYEGIILGTGFANRFQPSTKIQGQNDKRTCDMANQYTRRALLKYSLGSTYVNNLHAGWAEFVRTTTRRHSLPKCGPSQTMAKSLTWYRPYGSECEIFFCEACFLDNLALTRYGASFCTVDVMKDITSQFTLRTCRLNQMSMKELIWVCDSKRLPFSDLKSGMETIWAKPPCFTREGIKDGRWYNLRNEIGNYGVCEGCFAGIFAIDGMASFFGPIPEPSNRTLWCNFNSNVAHYAGMCLRFNEAIACGIFAVYEDYVRKWAPILPCAKEGLAKERAWYGWDDCLICQECYEVFVVGTSLAKSLPLQAEFIDAERFCSMYSPRMRGLYTAACKSGSTDELLSVSRERNAVYMQTVPNIRMLQSKIDNETMMAASNMQISATYSSAASIDSVFGSSKTQYWDSSLGGYGTSDTIASNNAWNQAMAGFNRANDPALHQQIAILRTKWAAVE